VRSLADIGFAAEADGFRRFVERSAAGSAEELQLMYGVDGSHRITELELGELEGYRGARPVRIGNAAQGQLQLDMYGYLLELTWQWTRRGSTPDETYWRFIVDVLDHVCACWQQPDHGIWELRGAPRHYVYSKALCWVALDRGVRLSRELAEEGGGPWHGVDADVAAWERSRVQIRRMIDEGGGVDARRNCFVEALGGERVDASALLLPAAGYVASDDPRMVATVDAVLEDLVDGGLVRRFRHEESSGTEGTFVACTFWLVERLAELGRMDEAYAFFDRATATANDLGLYTEEFDGVTGEALGNFPQGLSHLSHIGAARALNRHDLGRSRSASTPSPRR
jgi:GH15 family glucan-1,4-alpha-glucosidase